MNLKGSLCCILALTMLLLCACGEQKPQKETVSTPTNEAPTYITSLSLLYCANDSLNPYQSNTTLNRQLALLMFDPLFKLDNKFQPQKILAQSIDYNGKECTVTLKNATFSDSTPVTADDVVYSFKLAKESLSGYADSLETIKSAKADGQKIVFTLLKADPYIANLLDFPIFKANSEDIKNEDNIVLPPIGSGRYIFDIVNSCLTANRSCVTATPKIPTIKLINAPDDTVVKYNLDVGTVSIFNSDLSEGVVPPMVGKTESVPLTSLVYLGINFNNSFLNNETARYALATTIDRTVICNDAYHSYATPASGLFNSVWEDAGNLQNLPITADLQNVIAYLEEIGYNSKDDEGFYVNSKGNRLSLKLISYSGNQRRNQAAVLVKQQLEAGGIKIELKELSWEKYNQALIEGNFDLYIAETKLLNNMDVTELITSNGALSYGIPSPYPEEPKPDEEAENSSTDQNKAPVVYRSFIPLLDTAVSGFYGEELSLVDIINAFNAEIPIIPLCHRTGITVTDKNLKFDSMSSVSDVFFGITNID